MRALVLTAEWDPRPDYSVSEQEVRSQKAIVASKVWRHPRLAWQDLPDPQPQDDEVVVKVGACGVCGSDTHCMETDADGYILFSGPTALPVVLGHEYTGEVVAVGRHVKHLRIGDLVAAEGMLYCGVCEACRRGLPNQCPSLEMVGFSSPGAYAEYIAVREKHCWKIDGLAERFGGRCQGLAVGALIEPIACPFNGMFISAGGMTPGSHVAVYGCGPIGLGAILLARAAGAATIVGFDVSAERCRLAVQCGADEAWDPRELVAQGSSPSQVVRTMSRGWGADMQIEAAGAALATMPEIERAFAPAGRMVYLGRTGQRAPVFLDALVSGAAGIVGARGHAGGGCFPSIIRLLEHGRMDPSPMITATLPFPRVLDALQQSCLRVDGKIMVEYQE